MIGSTSLDIARRMSLKDIQAKRRQFGSEVIGSILMVNFCQRFCARRNTPVSLNGYLKSEVPTDNFTLGDPHEVAQLLFYLRVALTQFNRCLQPLRTRRIR